MSSAAELGGIFIVRATDVTALAFAQTTNMRETRPWDTD